MKTNRNSKIKKNKSNFWDTLPQINNKEKDKKLKSQVIIFPNNVLLVKKELLINMNKKC